MSKDQPWRDPRIPRHANPMQPNQQQVALPVGQVMIKGLRAEFHANRHVLKLQRHRFDVGVDLYPAMAPIQSEPLGQSWVRLWVHTHVHMAVPPGLVMQLTGRSSTSDKLGGAFVIPSIIDPGFAGELRIRIQCLKQDENVTRSLIMKYVNEECALAQVVIHPYVVPQFVNWSDQMVAAIGRHDNGYGSTDSIKGGRIIPPNGSIEN